MDASDAKLARAGAIIRGLGSVAVAYSGGVDSTLLLALALEALGPERVLAVTAHSATYPEDELQEAAQVAEGPGARLRTVQSHELEDPRVAANPPDRCYYCKQGLFVELWQVAREEGLAAVIYGANADDLGDHRPGMRAAEEQGGRAPLLEAGLTKDEIRAASRARGLPTWGKPAMACLSSRIPYGYGTPLTPEALRRVGAAEAFLRHEMGLAQLRVRHHDPVARLELEPEDWGKVLANRERIVARLRELGYLYVALDLARFRSGSLNDALRKA